VFEQQVATRLVEFHLLDLAMTELEMKRIWLYNWRPSALTTTEPDPMDIDQAKSETKGTQIRVHEDPLTERKWISFPGSRMTNQDTIRWDEDLVEYLARLQEDPFWILNKPLPILTEHVRGKQVFRGHPNYRQLGHWNDWVLVDWGGRAPQPCQIWCFLDLNDLPNGFNYSIDGVQVGKGTYAVVESADFEDLDPDEEEKRYVSGMFYPLVKEVEQLNRDGSIAKRKFFLADVESFHSPTSVFPDIGSPNKQRYFAIKSRMEWAEDFAEWLKHDHDYEKLAMDEEKDALDHAMYGSSSSEVPDDDSDEDDDDDSES
jgi:hypothetical protein